MNTPEHEFCSLSDAAEKLECDIVDLVKWGGAGKINLQIIYTGFIREGKLEYVDNEFHKKIGRLITKEHRSARREFMIIKKEDLLELYRHNVKRNSNDATINISEFAAQPFNYIHMFDLSTKMRTSHPISYSDLFIMAEELNRFEEEKKKFANEDYSPEVKDLERLLSKKHPYRSIWLQRAINLWIEIFEKNPPPEDQDKAFSIPAYVRREIKKKYPDIKESTRYFNRLYETINPDKKSEEE